MVPDDSTANDILSACLHVEQLLSQPWSLERLAALTNLSPYHFAHEFSRVKKEPPIQWLTRLRLEHAAIWLKFTTRPTSEIAVECGYQSREGLSRAFSKRFKRSPLEFRKKSQHDLDRLARKKSVRRAACPVRLVRRETAPMIFTRVTGPYHLGITGVKQVGKWARQHSVQLPDTSCIIINYDEPGITPIQHRRYDIGLICPDPIPMLSCMHRTMLPAGVYACAEFQGTFSGLIHAWNWFIAVWLRENDYYVREMRFFDEYQAPALLSRPLTWLDAIRMTVCCQLHIPVSTCLLQGALPVGSMENFTQTPYSARSVTHGSKE